MEESTVWHNTLIITSMNSYYPQTMKRETEVEAPENSEVDFALQLIENAKLLISADSGDNRMSLYRKGNNHYLIHFQENRIAKVEKISRNLAHLQFPGLIVR